MIQFYSIPPFGKLPSGSPFCLKLEAFLNFTQINYEKILTTNSPKAPKGKLPFIKSDGQLIGDTCLIIDYLSGEQNIDIDENLTSTEKAISHSFIKMIEEHLYWIIVYSRWLDGDAYLTFFKDLPIGIRSLLPRLIRRKIIRDMKGQGLLKHTRSEIYYFGQKNLQALSDFLEDQDTYFNSEVTLLDIVSTAFLSSILYTEINSPLQESLKSLPNLVKHCEKHFSLFYQSHENL